MKCLHLLLIAVAAFAFNACEKHPASELGQIDESKAPAAEAAKKSSAVAVKPAESGPAPKFFPDAK